MEGEVVVSNLVRMSIRSQVEGYGTESKRIEKLSVDGRHHVDVRWT